jgi:hypothetical protein
MYQENKLPLRDEVVSIQRISDGTSIPIDQANNDYQDYLKWLEEGNTPLPADEVTE